MTTGSSGRRAFSRQPAWPGHPILDGVPAPWPALLGYNQVTAKPDAEVLVRCGADPLLVVGSHGAGRSAAFTSDCAPHWARRPSWTGWDTTQCGATWCAGWRTETRCGLGRGPPCRARPAIPTVLLRVSHLTTGAWDVVCVRQP